MKRFITCFFTLFFLSASSWAAITAQVEPSTVNMGEVFRLTLILDGAQANGVPNLTPLQDDFTIVGTERSMSYSIDNGKAHTENRWVVLLTAKKKGVLTIPALNVGHQFSTPSRVTIKETNVTSDDESADLVSSSHEPLLKTSVNVEKPFINQQIIYTVKLYNNQRLLDAQYMPPRVEDALLVPLGEGRRYQTTMNEQRYNVEEQQYAIFPQKSGELNIIGPSFSALVFDTVPQRTKTHAKATRLQVKPIPTHYSGKQWLIANQVALTEVYDQKDTVMNQGSTLVRTITLQAAGVPAQLLPNLDIAHGANFNVYSEKPTLNNQVQQQDLVGRADIKVTYLFNTAGKISIPPLQLTWFNAATGKEEITTLPERTFEIKATHTEKVSPTTPTQDIPSTKLPSSKTATTPPFSFAKASPLAWWVAGGFATAWVLTGLLWWLTKRSFKKQQPLKNLRIACRRNAPHQAQEALLIWATSRWPNKTLLNLQQVAALVPNTALQIQLAALSNSLYGHNKLPTWKGKDLWDSVCAYLRHKPPKYHKVKKGSLPPINPS